jgi:hypothetical protein
MNGRKTFPCFVACAAFLALETLLPGEITKLPNADRKAVQQSSHFHELHGTKSLPPAVFALCVEKGGAMAEPGQPFQATDVIIQGQNLPGKRLIWAVTDGDYYIVHYERGGIAHSFHVLIAKAPRDHAKATLVWRAVGKPLKDYSAFVSALRSGSLDDRLDYAH